MSDTLHEYVGAIHIHTTFSDGRGDVESIAQIGGTVGLDFLLFSDHMTLEPLHLGLEGWHGDTLVLIGHPDQVERFLSTFTNLASGT